MIYHVFSLDLHCFAVIKLKVLWQNYLYLDDIKYFIVSFYMTILNNGTVKYPELLIGFSNEH